MGSTSEHEYFNQLNYSMANEDTTLEHALLKSYAEHVLCVCGSGGRALPLLARFPKRLTVVDLAPEQLYLAELRFETLRELDHQSFMSFWGYPPKVFTSKERKEVFHSLRLSSEAKTYLEQLFESKDWKAVLYEGRWEKTFEKLAKINQKITGKKGQAIFEAKDPKEYYRYLYKEFPKWRWNLTLMTLGNANTFNSLLYKGQFPKKNLGKSFYQFYKERLDHLFEQGPARNNFFLQYLFFGEIKYPEGNTIEADPKVFADAKEGLDQCEIVYRQGNVIEEARDAEVPIEFFSISDVPSYFSGDLERNFLQDVSPGIAEGGMVVLRNYLHIPENLNTDGYQKVTSTYQDLIDAEKVGVYCIDLFQKGQNS